MLSCYEIDLIFGLDSGAPVFIDWPRDQTAFEEATVEFACAADG